MILLQLNSPVIIIIYKVQFEVLSLISAEQMLPDTATSTPHGQEAITSKIQFVDYISDIYS